MRAFAALALVCVALVGCTEAQRYELEIGQRAQAAMVPFRECQARLEANPQFTRVYQKLAVSTVAEPFREPTSAQLSDNEIGSDADKAAFLAWFSEGQTCSTPARPGCVREKSASVRATFIEEVGRLAPEIEVYFAYVQADQADLLNEFIVNRHTFGEANAAIFGFKARIKIAAKEDAYEPESAA